MTLAQALSYLVTTLQEWSLSRTVHILETRQFSVSQFTLKVRAELADNNILQVRLYYNAGHLDYAYQLLRGELPILRWDNKEHIPSLATYPHHFHHPSGQVESNLLAGDVHQDLPVILAYLTKLLAADTDV